MAPASAFASQLCPPRCAGLPLNLRLCRPWHSLPSTGRLCDCPQCLHRTPTVPDARLLWLLPPGAGLRLLRGADAAAGRRLRDGPRVSTEVTFGPGALSTFPLAYPKTNTSYMIWALGVNTDFGTATRKGKNGVSTTGVAAIFVFFGRGTFGVLPLTRLLKYITVQRPHLC